MCKLFPNLPSMNIKQNKPLILHKNASYNLGHLSLFARSLLSGRNTNCWQCNTQVDLPQFTCPKCGTVLDPEYTIKQLNHFEVFDLEPKFEVDTQELSKSFKKLQFLLHPDKFATKDEKQKDYSADMSSLVNKSYAVLCDPLLRAEYLLQLVNISMDESQMEMDPTFLAKVLDENQSIGDAETAEELQVLNQSNQKEFDDTIKSFQSAYEKKEMITALRLFATAKFYRSMQDRIREKQRLSGFIGD